MTLSVDQYLEAIDQKHQGGLATLHNHHFLLKEDGKSYFYKKGTNAIVFKTESYSKLYAIRFFFHHEHELLRRYVQLEEYFADKKFSWKVPFNFLDKEYYPFVKMDWVEGLSFSEYLDTIIHNPLALGNLQAKLIGLSRDLEINGIGHGDLNLSHIRLVKQDSESILRLIDYDSMFIPPFKGKDSLRTGTAGFQHPMRLTSDFSETVDRFSFWVFITALEVFKIDPSLWIGSRRKGFNRTEQLIFNFSDLAFPDQSSIFHELKAWDNEALNFYIDKLVEFCNQRSADSVGLPQLFGEKIIAPVKKEETRPNQSSTNGTIIQKENALPSTIKPSIQKTTKPEIKAANETVFLEKKNEFVQLPTEAKTKEEFSRPERNNKTRRIILIAGALIVAILTSVYFIRPSKKSIEASTKSSLVENKNIASAAEKAQPVQSKTIKETSVFTSSNLTKALTQLYQSYNQRNLNSILSSYADTMDEYYDTASINKGALRDIIKNLFIKPYTYKCVPDWQSMGIENENNNSCNVTINLNETIKTKKKSKKEQYTSQIQYTLDKNFKITSEKRVS